MSFLKFVTKTDPMTRAIPSSSFPPAVKDVIISEAPLENASKVTPAKISERCRLLDILEIAAPK